MDSKKPWQSKTVWVNLILGIVAAISAFVPSAKVVSDWIAAHADYVAMGWAAINLVLRAVTKDKVQLTD